MMSGSPAAVEGEAGLRSLEKSTDHPCLPLSVICYPAETKILAKPLMRHPPYLSPSLLIPSEHWDPMTQRQNSQGAGWLVSPTGI